MNRAERHAVIQRLIREQPISTQAELAAALRRQGRGVVQTTVSRDVRELGLVKVRKAGGRLVYMFPEEVGGFAENVADALARWAISIEPSGSLVVVTTRYGYAQPLARAIDAAHDPHVAGTIAGENTVLVAACDPMTGAQLAQEIRTLKQAA